MSQIVLTKFRFYLSRCYTIPPMLITTVTITVAAAEGVVVKFPSIKIINPNLTLPNRTSTTTLRFGFRRFSFSFSFSSLSVVSAKASSSIVREEDPRLGPVSLEHIIRPDFPILH
ncbi:hypothetical protein LOK49_LG05G01391 [Camellia lanceoleosa]|uniref:Uncharacterized protein n=1 Tax=Camellia lanceoleosa TaxID=1840588 RepID=A0ACC0HNZ6_9ERIC|nr:hypothetical protein LOK49_LG05G01391 [Camellia lanceoleosa]